MPGGGMPREGAASARFGAGSTRGRGDGTAAGAALRQGAAGGSDRGGRSMRRTLPA
jgi:hypothetical protein